MPDGLVAGQNGIAKAPLPPVVNREARQRRRIAGLKHLCARKLRIGLGKFAARTVLQRQQDMVKGIGGAAREVGAGLGCGGFERRINHVATGPLPPAFVKGVLRPNEKGGPEGPPFPNSTVRDA